jgi:hypothetical protein
MTTRPIYETPEDLLKENDLRQKIESVSHWTLKKLPIKYGADFLAFDSDNPTAKPRAVIETKIRPIERLFYKTYMISLHKVVTGLTYSNILRIPFFLFVQWNDCCGYIQITEDFIANDVRMQKIDFRNDKSDIEPCVHVPTDKFKLL